MTKKNKDIEMTVSTLQEALENSERVIIEQRDKYNKQNSLGILILDKLKKFSKRLSKKNATRLNKILKVFKGGVYIDLVDLLKIYNCIMLEIIEDIEK